MNYSTKIINSKVKTIIVGHKTVEKFDPAIPVCRCSTFVKSLLVATWSQTLGGLNESPMIKTKSTEMKDLPKMSFTKKTV